MVLVGSKRRGRWRRRSAAELRQQQQPLAAARRAAVVQRLLAEPNVHTRPSKAKRERALSPKSAPRAASLVLTSLPPSPRPASLALLAPSDCCRLAAAAPSHVPAAVVAAAPSHGRIAAAVPPCC